MATIPISITVDPPTRNITVAPTVANCLPEDTVAWTVAGGTSLKLDFSKGTPFDLPLLEGPGAVQRGIPPTSPKGIRYHYALTATVGGKDYVIPGCPEIVVG